MILIPIWQYAHAHWQDNVIASGISFSVGYLAGARKHLKRLHVHLDKQDAKTKLIHKHIKEVHKHLGIE